MACHFCGRLDGTPRDFTRPLRSHRIHPRSISPIDFHHDVYGRRQWAAGGVDFHPPTPEAAGDPGGGLEPATGDPPPPPSVLMPLRRIDRPFYLYIRQTLRRRLSRSEAHQGDVYSYGLHVSVNPAQTPLVSCFERRCVHAQPCVTGAAAAAAGRVQSHTNPGQAARRTSHGEVCYAFGSLRR